MKFFGLLSLIIALGLGGWFIHKQTGFFTTGTAVTDNGQEAIEQAKTVSNELLPLSAPVVVYDATEVSRQIVILDLSKQGLTGSLKPEIGQLSNLKELYLNHNDFTTIPKEVGYLANLEVLDVSNNPHLNDLPIEIGNLQKLRKLDIRGTGIPKARRAEIKAFISESAQFFD